MATPIAIFSPFPYWIASSRTRYIDLSPSDVSRRNKMNSVAMYGEREAVTMARGKSAKERLRSRDDEGPRRESRAISIASFHGGEIYRWDRIASRAFAEKRRNSSPLRQCASIAVQSYYRSIDAITIGTARACRSANWLTENMLPISGTNLIEVCR